MQCHDVRGTAPHMMVGTRIVEEPADELSMALDVLRFGTQLLLERTFFGKRTRLSTEQGPKPLLLLSLSGSHSFDMFVLEVTDEVSESINACNRDTYARSIRLI
jgi:hypothetical protein